MGVNEDRRTEEEVEGIMKLGMAELSLNIVVDFSSTGTIKVKGRIE